MVHVHSGVTFDIGVRRLLAEDGGTGGADVSKDRGAETEVDGLALLRLMAGSTAFGVIVVVFGVGTAFGGSLSALPTSVSLASTPTLSSWALRISLSTSSP